MYVVPPRGVSKYYSADLPKTQLDWFASFSPGLRPPVLPEGTARFIPGRLASCCSSCTTRPTAPSRSDRSYVGIKFADPKTVKREVAVQHCRHARFRHSAARGQSRSGVVVHVRARFAAVVGFAAHARAGQGLHLQADSIPTARKRSCSNVPQYDFGWQTTYILAEPGACPRARSCTALPISTIRTDNLNNPDPTKEVRYGPQTWEEMMYGWFEICLADQDLSAELAETGIQHENGRLNDDSLFQIRSAARFLALATLASLALPLAVGRQCPRRRRNRASAARSRTSRSTISAAGPARSRNWPMPSWSSWPSWAPSARWRSSMRRGWRSWRRSWKSQGRGVRRHQLEPAGFDHRSGRARPAAQVSVPDAQGSGQQGRRSVRRRPHARGVRARQGPRGALLGPHRRSVRHRLSEARSPAATTWKLARRRTAGRQSRSASRRPKRSGCLIGRVKRPEPSGDVTYSKQIARILQNRCVECHHEGQIAPFSLDQLRRSGGLGRDDSRSGARAPHAALACRSGARATSRTTPRSPKRSSPLIELGRERLPRGRAQRPAAAGAVCQGLGHLQARPGLLHERQAVHRAGRRRGATIRSTSRSRLQGRPVDQQAEVKCRQPGRRASRDRVHSGARRQTASALRKWPMPRA